MPSEPDQRNDAKRRFRMRIIRTVALLFGLGLVPTGVLGYLVYRASAAATHELILANNTAAAVLSQSLVETEFEHRIHTLGGFAANPGFIQAVEQQNEEAVRERLQILVESQPRIERAFVTTPEGLLWSDFPKAPESLGVRFDHRDWYQGVSKDWSPYVSGVYRRNAEPRRLLVAVAAPVFSEDETIVGIVVYQIDLEHLTQLIRSLEVGSGGYALLVDHLGNVAAHPYLDLQAEEHGEYAQTLPVLAAQQATPSTQEYPDPVTGKAMLATSAPCDVGGNAWILIAQQGMREAFAPVRTLGFQIAGGGLLVALGLIGGLALMISYEYRLRDSNARLDALNQELSEDNRERRRMVRTLLANLPGMVYRCRNDDKRTVEFASAECEALTGYPAHVLLQDEKVAYQDLIHPDDREKVRKAVEGAVRSKEPFTLTYRIRALGGQEKWVWERGRVVADNRGQASAIEGFISDVTEQKSLEQQLLQSQKMEAIGQLAGGVAHDFNNLLTVITGYTAMLLEENPEPSTWREEIDEVHRAGERAAALTRQLLAFSRKQVLVPEVLDLNQVVGDMDKMLRRLIGENIDLVTRLAPNLHPVRFDPGQIEQIIMNLAVNARDAMPGGGKVTLETANVELDEAYTRSHPDSQPGDHVMIAITDTGIGMDAATRERIFDPFFTTKGVGQGTGLGLSTVFGIVKQSGGNIWVYSEPGRGTTFKVYLPRTEAEVREAPEAIEAPLRGHGETVLVVEDDESVRSLVCTLLEKQGYQVLDASDSNEAMAALEKSNGTIRVMLTDMVLTDGDGRELSRAALKKHASLKVIFMSGYTDNSVMHRGELDPGIPFIQKPIAPRELFNKVGRALVS